jgi:hypothetical protein
VFCLLSLDYTKHHAAHRATPYATESTTHSDPTPSSVAWAMNTTLHPGEYICVHGAFRLAEIVGDMQPNALVISLTAARASSSACCTGGRGQAGHASQGG